MTSALTAPTCSRDWQAPPVNAHATLFGAETGVGPRGFERSSRTSKLPSPSGGRIAGDAARARSAPAGDREPLESLKILGVGRDDFETVGDRDYLPIANPWTPSPYRR